MMPNYDKMRHSQKEVQAKDILNLLPASTAVLTMVLGVPRHEIESKLVLLRRQGVIKGAGNVWYPVKYEKAQKE